MHPYLMIQLPPTTVANTESTSIIVPIGPSTLSPSNGRNVLETSPGSSFLN